MNHNRDITATPKDLADIARTAHARRAMVRHTGQVDNITGPAPCYRFKSQQNDYIICRWWDGITEGNVDVKVAKKFKLRHVTANYAGLTSLTTVAANIVTAANGTITETWYINPSYEVNDFIYPAVVSFSGVTVDGADLKLVDEATGREWAVGK